MLQSPMKTEIFGLKAQLEAVTAEKNLLEDALRKIQYRVKNDVESNMSLQAQNYESRLTELHCVIAELKKQVDFQRESIIPEESTEDETDDLDRDQTEEEEEEEEVEEEDAGEQIDEYPGLPTPEPDVLSGAFTSTSSSSSSQSNVDSPDKPPSSTSKGVEVSDTEDGGSEVPRKNSRDSGTALLLADEAVRSEPDRRISVSRSRRRNLLSNCSPTYTSMSKVSSSNTTNSSSKNNNNYNHCNSAGSKSKNDPRHGTPLDKVLQAGTRDSEMRAWRDGNKKKAGSLGSNSSSGGLKQQPIGDESRMKQQQHHQQQQQQQQVKPQQVPERPRSEQGSPKECQEGAEMTVDRRQQPARVSPDNILQFAALRDEVAHIREEHFAIRETLFKKEGELDRTRSALESIAEERDFLKKKVYELEYLLKQSPKKFPQFMLPASDVPALPTSNTGEEAFTCRVAERVKLKQQSSTAQRTPTKRAQNHNNNNNNNNNDLESGRNHHHHQSHNNKNQNSQNDYHHYHHHQQQQQHHHHHHQAAYVNMNNSLVQLPSAGTGGYKGKNHSKGGTMTLAAGTTTFITGQELVAIGNSCSTRIVEHLVQPLQDESTVSEVERAFAAEPPGSVAEEKLREFEIETERLNSRLEHLRSQNDVLTLNLDDAKSHADRLTVLLGKYESNNVGHQIALSLSDQLIEAYDVLVALLESELGLLLANCRAAGIGASSSSNASAAGNGTQSVPDDDFDVASLLQRANENRMTAEIAARNLVVRMVDSPGSENNNGMMLHLPVPHPSASNHPANHHHHHSNVPPWEDASSCSQTLSSASSVGDSSSHSHAGAGGESRSGSLEKNEEQRVRDLIIQLKTEREAVRNTLVELENWSLEPQSPMQPHLSPCDILEARKLDLETAVLMQELMAMREDRAELRAQLFVLEKEKGNLEFKLGSYEAQQDAYRARINHLNAELADLQESTSATAAAAMTGREITDTTSNNLNENNGGGGGGGVDSNVNNNNNQANNNTEREVILKRRIQELAASLEKVTHNANLREHQSHETVNELKKANNILLETLETVKRKYQNRIKKMEEQIVAIVERHSVQMKLYKERVHLLEAEMMERSQHL